MSTTSSASASKYANLTRMSGLVSGLDTENLVKSMAANSKTRYNRKAQKLQTLQWKQEAYRNQISALSSFQSKYLTTSSTNSLKLTGNLKKFTSTISDTRVTATATSNAKEATYTIVGAQNATAAAITGDKGLIKNGIDMDFSAFDALGEGESKTTTLKITLDGVTKEVEFSGTDSASAKENLLTSLNTKFGLSSEEGKKHFEFDESGTLSFNNQGDGITHTFNIKYNSDVGLKNDTYNQINSDMTLGSINFTNGLKASYTGTVNGESANYYTMDINGEMFTFNDKTTINEMISTVNSANIGAKMSFSTYTQSFKIEASETGNNQTLDVSKNDLYNTLFGSAEKVDGNDSTITILAEDGNTVTYTNASNNYTFDGTTINVSKLGSFEAKKVDGEYTDAITVTTAKDTSAAKDMIVNFINDYNTLIQGIYKEMTTTRAKSNGSYYEPLTDEQKEEMDTKEIDKWNEQAKVGILYQDGYMSTLYNSLVSAMGSAVNGVTLADMGISSKQWSDNGKLTIDEDKLNEFLTKNGDKAVEFFTDINNGMSYKVDNAINKAISTSTGKVGYLSGLAGVEGTTTDKKNSMYTEINSLQKLVSSLKEKYEAEMERYWKKFTTLETYMSNMNSQASIFATE